MPPSERVATPRPSPRRWPRRLRRAGGCVGIGLLLLLVGGTLANAGLERAARVPPPGRLVAVGDHRLHIHCVGTGGPAVVLEAGAGSSSLLLTRLQRALASSVRACVYDRAGLGWSEAGDGRYDIATASSELHLLLRASEVPLPVVLVGHSLGANIAAHYAAAHPEDLAGVVLVDPGVPEDMLEDFRGTETEALAIDDCGWKCGAGAAAARTGLVRLAMRMAGAGSKTLTPAENARYRAEMSRPSSLRAAVGSLVFLPKSALQARDARGFGDVPVTVVYSGDTRKPEGDETPADVARWHARTLERMRELAAGSSRGRGPVVVPGATHVSVVTQPAGIGAIVAETLRLAGLSPAL